ncbi:hypothetical protein J3B02_004969 [Coemansia erecta]|nr:hypothetical protein J3B02_004969 [Coemansia erecta]
MLYISDSDSSTDCRRPFKRQRSHQTVQSQETQPISVNSTSLSSMASSVLLIRPSTTNQAIEYATNNSSGWSSLLDMSSAISLLSSYTPQKKQPSYALNPIDDVDDIDDIDDRRPPQLQLLPHISMHHPAPVYPLDYQIKGKYYKNNLCD